MNDATRLFSELLGTTEIRKIDFKCEQYRLDNVPLKSEFIKDILCMANSPGDDGYILLGIKADKGVPRDVKGISSHHDGSDLEEIVNGVIDEPIQFEYHALKYKGNECALLHIPKSKAKPHWPRKDYGVLRKHVIYTRRSSGNREASIQEIREMCVETIHISDIAQRKVKLSHHILDELENIDLNERAQAMYLMLKGVARNIGLVKYQSLLAFSSSRHWSSIASSKGRKINMDYIFFMYPWTAGYNEIQAARYNAANLRGDDKNGRQLPNVVSKRLKLSTLIHISYKSLNTKSLQSRPFYSSECEFANEWKLPWGKVMKWEGTLPTLYEGKATYRTNTKYEFFLPDMSSKAELSERLCKLLVWVDENLNQRPVNPVGNTI